MPGAIYQRSLRLARAYSEGFAAPNGAINPHPSGTPAADAWAAGYDQCNDGVDCADDDCYKGNAENTGDAFCSA